MALFEVRDLRKSFRSPDGEEELVVDVPRLDLEAGEQVALVGASGSGKTTLLHLFAGILRPDAGSIVLDGVDLARLSEAARDRVRARDVGIVFQSFHLLQGHGALENVLLAMAFGSDGVDRARAVRLLERLDLGDRLRHRPRELSVGQQQRVAVARALASRPRLVLADEPTGNLDPRRADEALELLCGACREEGAALVVVTHDPRALERFDRRLELAELRGAGARP